MVEYYVVAWPICFFVLLEFICVGWVYGWDRMSADIGTMLGRKTVENPLFQWWNISWKGFGLLAALYMVIDWFVNHQPLIPSWAFPSWTNTLGWFISFAVASGALLWCGLYPVKAMVTTEKTNEVPKLLFRPQKEWAPALHAHKNERNEYERVRLARVEFDEIERSKQRNQNDSKPVTQQSIPMRDISPKPRTPQRY